MKIVRRTNPGREWNNEEDPMSWPTQRIIYAYDIHSEEDILSALRAVQAYTTSGELGEVFMSRHLKSEPNAFFFVNVWLWGSEWIIFSENNVLTPACLDLLTTGLEWTWPEGDRARGVVFTSLAKILVYLLDIPILEKAPILEFKAKRGFRAGVTNNFSADQQGLPISKRTKSMTSTKSKKTPTKKTPAKKKAGKGKKIVAAPGKRGRGRPSGAKTGTGLPKMAWYDKLGNQVKPGRGRPTAEFAQNHIYCEVGKFQVPEGEQLQLL